MLSRDSQPEVIRVSPFHSFTLVMAKVNSHCMHNNLKKVIGSPKQIIFNEWEFCSVSCLVYWYLSTVPGKFSPYHHHNWCVWGCHFLLIWPPCIFLPTGSCINSLVTSSTCWILDASYGRTYRILTSNP